MEWPNSSPKVNTISLKNGNNFQMEYPKFEWKFVNGCVNVWCGCENDPFSYKNLQKNKHVLDE